MSIANTNNNVQVNNRSVIFDCVQKGLDHQYIYVKNNAAYREGVFSHLFTRASVNIATSQALEAEIREKFGEDTANVLKAWFRQFESGKRQLTVRDAREIFTKAQNVKENVGRIRESQSIIQRTYGPVISNLLSESFDNSVRDNLPYSKVSVFMYCSAQNMKNHLDKVYTKADTMIAEKNPHWDEPTRQLFHDALEATISNASEMIEPESEALSSFLQNIPDIINGVEGKGDTFLALTDSAQKRDLLQMIGLLGMHGCPTSVHMMFVEALAEIRRQQPIGPIDKTTIYRAVLKQDPPGRFGSLSHKNASSVFAQHLDNFKKKELAMKLLNLADPENNPAHFDTELLSKDFFFNGEDLGQSLGDLAAEAGNYLNTYLSSGIPFDSAVQAAAEKTLEIPKERTIDFSKACVNTNLFFPKHKHTSEDAGDQFRKDFSRMVKDVDVGSKTDCVQLKTVPSFTFETGEKTTVFKATTNEAENGAMADAIMEKLEELCEKNPEQYRLCLWTLTQSSPLQFSFRNIIPFLRSDGTGFDEHTPLDYNISKNDNGEITISMKLPSGRGYKAEATHIIKPDGTTETTHFVLANEKPTLDHQLHLELIDTLPLEESTRKFFVTCATEGLKQHPEVSLTSDLRRLQEGIKEISRTIDAVQNLDVTSKTKALNVAMRSFAMQVYQAGSNNKFFEKIIDSAVALGLQSVGSFGEKSNALQMSDDAFSQPLKNLNLSTEELNKRLVSTGKKLFMNQFCLQMVTNLHKGFEPGLEGTQFNVDCNRQIVFLPDGKPLSKKPREARDQLARFVTQKADTSFDALNEMERKKVCVALAMLNQMTTAKATEEMPQYACDVDNPLFFFLDHNGQYSKNCFFLSFGEDGSLCMTFNYRTDGFHVVMGDGGLQRSGEEGMHGGNMEVRISEETMKKIIDFDFSTLDLSDRKDGHALRQFEALPKGIQELTDKIEISAVFEGQYAQG